MFYLKSANADARTQMNGIIEAMDFEDVSSKQRGIHVD
jgi:hypothetical protein